MLRQSYSAPIYEKLSVILSCHCQFEKLQLGGPRKKGWVALLVLIVFVVLLFVAFLIGPGKGASGLASGLVFCAVRHLRKG